MEALLKRYYTKVQYFIGSVMSIADLQRVKVSPSIRLLSSMRQFCFWYQVDKATACLIIADKECPDPDGDDSANIMRVISLKNFNQRIRVLLQLLHYRNKVKHMDISVLSNWSVLLPDECRFNTWLECQRWRWNHLHSGVETGSDWNVMCRSGIFDDGMKNFHESIDHMDSILDDKYFSYVSV